MNPYAPASESEGDKTHRLPGVLISALAAIAIVALCDNGVDAALRQNNVLEEWREKHNPNNAEIVIVGNSLTKININAPAIGAALGKKVLVVEQFGRASAWFYLALKNEVAHLTPPPKVVILLADIPFHIADPNFRSFGAGAEENRKISEKYEPVLNEVLSSSTVEEALLRSAMFRNRQKLQDVIYMMIRDRIFGYWGLSKKQGVQMLNLALPGSIADTSASAPALSPIEDSFVPHIADEMLGITPHAIIIRSATKTNTRNHTHPQTDAYVAEFKEYIEGKSIQFWDYSKQLKLSPNDFRDERHYEAAGKVKFTNMLIRDLQQYINTL